MALSKISILVVDDEEDIRDLIQEQFENFGFNVDVASGGNEGWEMFNKHQYDVVITDIRMPEGTGPELLKKIKNANVHKPKLFFISGHFDFSLAEIYELGADGLFPKPFRATVLRESIKKATLPAAQKWVQKKLYHISQNFNESLNDDKSNIKLGRGGFYLQIDDGDIPEEDDEVSFDLNFGGEIGEVKGDGKVVWVRNGKIKNENLYRGIGVEIHWLDKSCVEKVKSYLDGSSLLPYIPKG